MTPQEILTINYALNKVGYALTIHREIIEVSETERRPGAVYYTIGKKENGI